MILIIKHIDIEGPEMLGAFFQKKGLATQTLDLSRGDKLPSKLNDLEAVICLGGPMNVYEEDKYPFLKDENIFIQNVLKERIPYLGICLGSQLLAKAAGARVTKSPVKEVGWFSVDVTKDGASDPIFHGIGENFAVYQWHEDMFELPGTGKLLATASGCPHQAMRVGETAYGLQFHIEITDKSIREWTDKYFANNTELLNKLKPQMLKEYNAKKVHFEETAYKVFANFLSIIEQRRKIAT